MEASEIEELRARLEAAERACVLFGWLRVPDDSERGKAALQAWMDWAQLPGVDTSREGNPELDDAAIQELARRRDEIRARTLERILAEGS